MAQSPPVVLTIAGFDPSSGAGVTADVKTIAAHGCYGVACITALTVQSTAGVRRVEAVSPELVAETLAGTERRPRDFGGPHRHAGLGEGRSGGRRLPGGSGTARTLFSIPIIKSSSGHDLIDRCRACAFWSSGCCPWPQSLHLTWTKRRP